MKASVKFRDEQKPLIRAKVPLSILGFPFQSGVVAGESKELSLNLATSFDSGPSLKFSYRPNDSFNPFSFVFKSGIGHFGSPISSSMTMSAEFNVLGKQNPRFFVHFKPQIGDFTLKKWQSSDFGLKLKSNSVISDEEQMKEEVELPAIGSSVYFPETDLFSGKKFTVLPSLESPASGMVKNYLSGVEVTARTAVPVRNYAVMNLRWGVRLPHDEEAEANSLLMRSHPMAEISFKNFPLLVLNKIGVEHVAVEDEKECDEVQKKNANMAASYLDVRQQLEGIQLANAKLRKDLADLRSEVISGRREIKYSGGGNRKLPETKDFEAKML